MDSTAVAEALGAEVTAVEIQGGIRFHVTRGEASAKFDLHDGYINWVSIQSPGGGWLDDAVDFVKTVAPEYGVKYVYATAGSERSHKALTSRGFKPYGLKLRLTV